MKTPPTSWADVWSNPAYKGRVILFDYLWPYTGVVQAARMNGGNEANPDAGFKIWSEHTDQLLALVTSTQQAQNLIARGDAWITIWAKGNVQQWADAGAPVGFAVPKEGLVAFPLFFQIVVGTKPDQQAVAEKDPEHPALAGLARPLLRTQRRRADVLEGEAAGAHGGGSGLLRRGNRDRHPARLGNPRGEGRRVPSEVGPLGEIETLREPCRKASTSTLSSSTGAGAAFREREVTGAPVSSA